jgi:hypothetical protein
VPYARDRFNAASFFLVFRFSHFVSTSMFSTLHFNFKWWMVSRGGSKHAKFNRCAGCNLSSGRCLVQGNLASAKVLVPWNNDNALSYECW